MKAGKLKKIEVSESKVNKDDLDEQKDKAEVEDEETIENNDDNE